MEESREKNKSITHFGRWTQQTTLWQDWPHSMSLIKIGFLNFLFWLLYVSNFLRVSIAAMKHLEQKVNDGRVYLIYISLHHCSLLKEVMTVTQSWQELGGKSWSRTPEGVLLIGFLLMTCSFYFLIKLRITSPGMAPFTIIWALFHQSLIKNWWHGQAQIQPELLSNSN